MPGADGAIYLFDKQLDSNYDKKLITNWVLEWFRERQCVKAVADPGGVLRWLQHPLVS